ncbi:hypothetical protein SCLCIDRAFT_1224792 [Scleroderma citrinum Foug A]|uniref:Uncharacterized protein n=1 Tax=Scleroderma citrinum Foug A TaxID=1036808 RepID=A0A0C3CRG3_9AGAM|nr:hypothetical protein SCLCIDRAFT_1224792 [Scleroderma citrinum Foug A]
MAARNKVKAEAAISALKEEGLGPGNGEVVWLELDLSDPRNAKRAAKEFMRKEDRLDVLIHNGALMFGPYEMLPDDRRAGDHDGQRHQPLRPHPGVASRPQENSLPVRLGRPRRHCFIRGATESWVPCLVFGRSRRMTSAITPGFPYSCDTA